MLSDCGEPVFINTLGQMPAGIPDILCIAQITLVIVTSMMTKDPLVPPRLPVNEDTVHRVVLPFKDQTSADVVICAMQSMSGIPAGICTNVSMNTGSPQSERI